MSCDSLPHNAEYGSCPACCSMFCLGKPSDTQNAHDPTCRVHGLGFILNTLISGTCNLWHKFEDSVDRSATVLIMSKWVVPECVSSRQSGKPLARKSCASDTKARDWIELNSSDPWYTGLRKSNPVIATVDCPSAFPQTMFQKSR